MSWLTASKTNSTTLSVTCAVHSGRANRTGNVVCTSSPGGATARANVTQLAAESFIQVIDPGSGQNKNIAYNATSVTLILKTNGSSISWEFSTPQDAALALELTPVSCSIGAMSHTFSAAEISAKTINVATCDDFGRTDFGLASEYIISFVFSCSVNAHASSQAKTVTFTESPGGDEDYCTVRQAGANATIEIEDSSEYTFPNFAASGGTQTATVSTNDTDWSPQANED